MKKMCLLIIFIVMLTLSISCADNKKSASETNNADSSMKIEWIEDYNTALETAEKENKLVFIDFTGSDWCGWCMKLDKEVFDKDVFVNYAQENFVMLKLDFPKGFKELPEDIQKSRSDVMQKYGVKGFPTILITDAKGEVKAQTGYQEGGPEKYIEHLKEIIK